MCSHSRFIQVESGPTSADISTTTPDVVGHSGAYLADCGVGVEGANVGRNGFEPYITDESRADALWSLSEQLIDA